MIANLTAANVMDKAAAHLNDVAKTKYTYAIQIPYLNTALQEMELEFALENIPTTDQLSAELTLLAGATTISRSSTPALPTNFIEPIKLYEKTSGQNGYIPIKKVNSLIPNTGIVRTQFSAYTWNSGRIGFLESSADIDVLIEYTGALFTPITTSTDAIAAGIAQTFLEYRTAGLCAKFIDEDDARANELNGYAGLALDKVTGIGAKGRQNLVTRRRPFRGSYRRG